VANPNPWRARMEAAAKRKPADLTEARQQAWVVLCVAYERIATSRSSADQRKWCLAYSQLVAMFAKLFEVGEIEARLKAVESLVETMGER
jgi:hypothetical protein